MAEEEIEEGQAPEGGAEAQEGEQSKKKLSLGMVGIVIQSIVLIAMVGLAYKAVFLAPKPDLSKKTLGERVIASIRDEASDIQHMSLEELVMNIDNEHTIKAFFILELSDSEILKIFEARTPIIRSKILEVLRNQEFAKIDKIQGKLELKDRLVHILNEELAKSTYKGNGTVRDIYFVNFVLI